MLPAANPNVVAVVEIAKILRGRYLFCSGGFDPFRRDQALALPDAALQIKPFFARSSGMI